MPALNKMNNMEWIEPKIAVHFIMAQGSEKTAAVAFD